MLSDFDFKPSRLELEITEGVFLADSDATDGTFARLKSLGVRLALDDFGTGYSSLGYLKKAPFDKIKIDQSFVRGAASTTKRNGAIIRAIVTLADSLDMDTTAEGVETHDDLFLIRELGVSQVQGYIFGKPMPAEEARKLANSSRVEADGFQCIREPRQRLMRRAIAAINGQTTEIRLRNISAMGALVECDQPVSPGDKLTIDIVGVGPGGRHRPLGTGRQVRRPVHRAIRPRPTCRRSRQSRTTSPCFALVRLAGQGRELGRARQNASTGSAIRLSAPASTLRRSAPATTSSRSAKKRAVAILASWNALSSPASSFSRAETPAILSHIQPRLTRPISCM